MSTTRQPSRLFVKLLDNNTSDDCNAQEVICDPSGCRVCVRQRASVSPADDRLNSNNNKPKWWKAISKSNIVGEWKNIPVDVVFPPDTSNRSLAAECLPMLINSALEGTSSCLTVSNTDATAADEALYGKSVSSTACSAKSLLATCVSWLFDLIDTFRVTRSSVRFSVRVSALHMSINTTNNSSCNNNGNNGSNNSSGIGEITTADLLEHIAQDGSSGDIPKLLGIGRLSGPRELRAFSAKQALAYVDAALKAAKPPANNERQSVFVFSLNVYQYQIERQPNGSETISGGRGQFHFVDLATIFSPSSEESNFATLQEKVITALSKNLPVQPTAFSSLTSQIFREFQRCRLCHFLALMSPQHPKSKRLLTLFDVPASASSTRLPGVLTSKLPKSSTTKRRQSPLDIDCAPRLTSTSFESATLPRLCSFTTSSSNNAVSQLAVSSSSSSIHGPLSNCVSGSELSLHTVIHRLSPSPPFRHRPAQSSRPVNNNTTSELPYSSAGVMQTSMTSSNGGAPPLLAAASHFTSLSLSRPSAFSDSETESVCRLRQPSLAPMQPVECHENQQISDDDVYDDDCIARLNKRRNGTSVSANCSPVKQSSPSKQQQQQLQQEQYQKELQQTSKTGRIARLKRFASSRMKRQAEQQKIWALMAATSKPNNGCSKRGDEIWIDGPGAVNQKKKMQHVEDWIDGPKANHQLSVKLSNSATPSRDERSHHSRHHRSLPRMRRHHGTPQQAHHQFPPMVTANLNDPLVSRPVTTLRCKKPNSGKNRPPSISCSSENIFVDSGYHADMTTRSSGFNSFNKNNKIFRPPLPPAVRPVMDSLIENVDCFQQKHYHHNLQRLQATPVLSAKNCVTWAPGGRYPNNVFAQPPVFDPNIVKPISEAKKIQSPFMRLKNKILGTNKKQQNGPTSQIPASPAVVSKRQHHALMTAGSNTSSQQQQQQQQQNSTNRMSRLTDTSDSGNDSGVALFGKSTAAGQPDDALSTTKSLSSSSSASPPSPAPGLPGQTNNQKCAIANGCSSGSVCSHSSGRGSSSSLFSHSVGGSQPSIAESAELAAKIQVQAWPVNLSSVEEELASAVSVLHQTHAPNTSTVQAPQQQQQQQQQQPQPQQSCSSSLQPKVPTVLNIRQQSQQLQQQQQQQQQHLRHLKLDISEVSESPSRDELLCLESLEQQLLS